MVNIQAYIDGEDIPLKLFFTSVSFTHTLNMVIKKMIIKQEHLLGLLFFRYAEVILTKFRIYDHFNQTFFFFLNAEYFIKNEQYLHSIRIYYLLFSWSMDFSVLISWVFHSNLPDSPNGEWPHFYCNILQFSSVTWSYPIL